MANSRQTGRGTRKSTILKRRSSAAQMRAKLLRNVCIFAGAGLLLLWGSMAVTNSAWPKAIADKIGNTVVDASVAQGWKLDRVLVNGQKRITKDQLTEALNVAPGMPILFYDIDDAAARVAQIGWVASARIERRLPDTLVVNIVERQPVALWRQSDGRIQVIDGEGVVVSPFITPEFKSLLLVEGNNAPAHLEPLLGALTAEPSVAKQVDQARWVGDRRWDIVLKNGIVIKLPENDLQPALERVAKAQRRDDIFSKAIDHVDLRDPLRVIVKPKAGEAGDIQLNLVSTKADPA
jgi:cell division protein FtsQ